MSSRTLLSALSLGALLHYAALATAQTPPAEAAAPTVSPAPETAPAAEQTPATAGAAEPAASLEATSAAPEPEAPAPVVEGAGASDEVTAEELAELGLDTSGTDIEAVDTSFRLYGFADFSFVGSAGKWAAAYQRYPTFMVGNLNLYMSKNITDTVRTFAEVRFMILPHGSRALGAGEYTSTDAVDSNDNNRPLHWGAIEIERVYLEWSMFSWLSVRAGRFLTPYGIWNVDHGSPVVIPTMRPFVVGMELFPERQTGIELLGSTYLNANHMIGYHLTLSNGLGPVSEVRELDGNKAVGGRLYWGYDGLGELKVGASWFYGRETAAHDAVGLDAAGDVVFDEQIELQSDVLAFAGDVLWKYKGLHVQAELITQQRKYTDDGRGGAVHPLLGEYLAPKDTVSFGPYALIGYRFDWLGVMPYLWYSELDFVEPVTFTDLRARQVAGGLNVRPIDAVVIKGEYRVTFWPEGGAVTDEPIQTWGFQLAWAF